MKEVTENDPPIQHQQSTQIIPESNEASSKNQADAAPSKMPIVSRIDLHENEEGHEDDEKKLDDRWNKKMSRAMTMISVVEDDHPCWAKVDAVWSEYGLTKD